MNSSRDRLADKAQAKALYIAGIPPDEVAKICNLPNSETITNWARKEGWQVARTQAMENLSSSMLEDLLQKQKEKLNDLSTIMEKAINSISDGTAAPQKFSEASNAYINALAMEQKIKSEALQISFVTDVFQAIKDEIIDPTALFRIGERLRKVLEKYKQTSSIARESDD